VLRGALVAVSAAAAVLTAVELVTLLAWAADARATSGSSAALRTGAAVWLAGLHTRVHAGAAVFGLPPLGLTLLCAALLGRLSVPLLPEGSPARQRVRAVAAVAVPHALIATLVAGLVTAPGLNPSLLTAAVGGLAVGAAGAAWGLRDRTSPADRRAGAFAVRRRGGGPDLLAATAASLAALVAVAAVVGGLALTHHAGRAVDLQRALGTGALGGAALTLLQLCAVPNAVIALLGYLAGTGFSVGAGTSVRPSGSTLGAVPALPLLAGLPGGRGGPGLLVVLVVPVAAGALAAWLLHRRRSARGELVTPVRAAALSVVSALLAGLLAGTAVAAAGGPVGAGRLLTVGASGWRTGSALTAELALGGLLVAPVLAWRARGGPGRLGARLRERWRQWRRGHVHGPAPTT